MKKKALSKNVLEISESYQEYMENIYRLSLQNPGGWVSNKAIAQRLKVKAPSVTNMLEKLTQIKYIEWKPRSGIRLTDSGREEAKKLVVNHIIAELFLERILKIDDPDLIDKIACDFEHHITPSIVEKIKNLLGIEDVLKNVDNFIQEDKLPFHLSTQSIFSEQEVLKIISDLELSLITRFNSIEDQNFIKELFQNIKNRPEFFKK